MSAPKMITAAKRLRGGFYGTAGIGTVVAGMWAIDETFRERLAAAINAEYWRGDVSNVANGLTSLNSQVRNFGGMIGDAIGVQHAGMPLVFFAIAGLVLFVVMFRA